MRRAATWAMRLGLLAAIAYAFLVEPYWVEVTRHEVAAPLAKPLKIVHLSDLHVREVGFREHRVLEIVASERPDVVVVTGDSVTSNSNWPAIHELLQSLRAPLGTWVVSGNWDHWRPPATGARGEVPPGVQLLRNRAARLRDGVWLAGFDDELAGRPVLRDGLAGIPAGAYVVALFHSPAFFDQVAGSCALALAGHTHGGQIRLPLLGALWVPPSSGRYQAGWYEQRGSQLYVSRGVGTSILPVRFLCRPEVAVISLVLVQK